MLKTALSIHGTKEFQLLVCSVSEIIYKKIFYFISHNVINLLKKCHKYGMAVCNLNFTADLLTNLK
jgi:hypothetical protein